MSKIDLRSDTVTQPTRGMLQAMMQAVVGDDVIDIDPTVRDLENKLAALFGFERGLFCPSGTMANQIAMMYHLKPGDEVICEERSHIYWYEGGGVAANAGASIRLVYGEKGCIKAEDVRKAINPENEHAARTRLISLENTGNKAGGTCYDVSTLQSIRAVAEEHNLPVHMDGARIFNALVATGQSTVDHHGLYDSMSICLSKGLGCPVGSVLLVSDSMYHEVRRIRKRLGGGMRQSGFLAAAGLYALDFHVDRLANDHLRAKRLANGIAALDWIERVVEPQTNIVIFYPKSNPKEVIHYLESSGVRIIEMGGGALRMVTHLHISDEVVEQTLDVMRDFLN
jgi:threonine aldolase